MIRVAIDGPSGAGKSSVSKAVAKKLGFIYIDTGAMYRSLAYKAIKNNIEICETNKKVEEMLSSTSIDICHRDDGQHMFVDGADVTDKIRTPNVSMGASAISAIPLVRAWLLDMQRNFANENNCIMDGRDIGTVVLPNAEVKIFLTASPKARAQRRYKELLEKDSKTNFADVLSDIEKRDKNDMERSCAPLKMADDAVELNTDDLTFEESVDRVVDIIEEKVGKCYDR